MALYPSPGGSAVALGDPQQALQGRHENASQSLADITPPQSLAVTPRTRPTGSPRSAPYMPNEATTLATSWSQPNDTAMTVSQETQMLMTQ